MCIVYFLQCTQLLLVFSDFLTPATDLDKLSLGYAAVFGLIEDLHLQGSEYSWCTSIFYFGAYSDLINGLI